MGKQLSVDRLFELLNLRFENSVVMWSASTGLLGPQRHMVTSVAVVKNKVCLTTKIQGRRARTKACQ